LLALARGNWNGRELVPRWFVEELETKQTYGMRVNYDGPNDGKIGLSPQAFPECPYGYLTWVNTDRDLYVGADRAWACGRGAGGSVVLWNHRNGIVFAGVGIRVRVEGVPPSNRGQDAHDTTHSIAWVIEKSIAGSNPLADGKEEAVNGR
jgi:hypothetical protein